jgi:protein SCO1
MRMLRYVLWGLVAMALAGAAAFYIVQTRMEDDNAAIAVKIGGPFSMTNHYGEPVTEKTYAGRPLAIFFGFTYCPDICPTTLARLSALPVTRPRCLALAGHSRQRRSRARYS